MTGIRHRTGLPLDELGPDDFDLAVVGDRIFEDAKAIGMKPRDGRRRTGPMRGKHVEALGLAELQDRLSALATPHGVLHGVPGHRRPPSVPVQASS